MNNHLQTDARFQLLIFYRIYILPGLISGVDKVSIVCSGDWRRHPAVHPGALGPRPGHPVVGSSGHRVVHALAEGGGGGVAEGLADLRIERRGLSIPLLKNISIQIGKIRT